jgi:hypothetical protein
MNANELELLNELAAIKPTPEMRWRGAPRRLKPVLPWQEELFQTIENRKIRTADFGVLRQPTS